MAFLRLGEHLGTLCPRAVGFHISSLQPRVCGEGTAECTDHRPCKGLAPRIEERLHHRRIAACDERQPIAPDECKNRVPCKNPVRFATDSVLDVYATLKFQLVVLLVERQLLEEPKQRILTVVVKTSEATPSLQK